MFSPPEIETDDAHQTTRPAITCSVKRSTDNPILTRADIPDVFPHVHDVSSVFNPGAIRLDDRYLLLLILQTAGSAIASSIAFDPRTETLFSVTNEGTVRYWNASPEP